MTQILDQGKFVSGSVAHTTKYHDWSEIDFIENIVRNFCQNNNFDYKDSYAKNLDFLDGPYDKVLVLYTRELMPTQERWADIDIQCADKGKMLYVISDVWGHMSDLPHIKFFLRPELSGVWSSFTAPARLSIKKLFSCFVQRVESVRQSWFYFLSALGLLEQGYVSFWFDQLTKQHGATRQEVFENNHFDFGLDQLPHFQLAYQTLKNQVPYCNFQGDIETLLAESKYSIVLETFATQDSHTAFACNEKTFRELQFGAQPLIFAQPGLLKALAQKGMWIPEYLMPVDQTPQWQARQRLLLDMLSQDTVNLSDHENLQRALHNRNTMQVWRDNYHKPQFFDEIFDQISQ
jgi:hypothetical protein